MTQSQIADSSALNSQGSQTKRRKPDTSDVVSAIQGSAQKPVKSLRSREEIVRQSSSQAPCLSASGAAASLVLVVRKSAKPSSVVSCKLSASKLSASSGGIRWRPSSRVSTEGGLSLPWSQVIRLAISSGTTKTSALTSVVGLAVTKVTEAQLAAIA